ncbi:hypothetical protein QS306_03970 [Paraburkholderia bonniea]|uniref:ankyrin repeat domain-containing protein n=1 Tax=Paraburkholderia bonniea TaxID=2152891 RepID=UPI0012924973|nr:ankyrin repeat domain-containing protein [Paraburkholderia bonniea]WJF90830.1 hypothetical protein QS306_03970 [Paraburkholderia bonniea]WJF94144.1 hypothetical protein QS308_03970 [Paraburkholderia bonniea]
MGRIDIVGQTGKRSSHNVASIGTNPVPRLITGLNQTRASKQEIWNKKISTPAVVDKSGKLLVFKYLDALQNAAAQFFAEKLTALKAYAIAGGSLTVKNAAGDNIFHVILRDSFKNHDSLEKYSNILGDLLHLGYQQNLDFSEKGSDGYTLLHLAACLPDAKSESLRNMEEIIKYCDWGVINAMSSSNETAFFIALKNNNYSNARYLLKNGANPEIKAGENDSMVLLEKIASELPPGSSWNSGARDFLELKLDVRSYIARKKLRSKGGN